MDWQFKVGTGIALVSALLPFAVKDMPPWATWPGIAIGILFAIWGVLPNHEKIPMLPAFMFIFSVAGIVASAILYAGADSEEPLKIQGYVLPYDPVDGVIVSGITWHPGYAHSVVLFNNATSSSILNLDVLIKPDFPLIKSVAKSDFAQCKIFPAIAPPPPVVLGGDDQGNTKIAGSDAGTDDDNIVITEVHRLFCEKLPARTTIQVTLATVSSSGDRTMSPTMFDSERQDPKLVIFQVSYEVDGHPYSYQAELRMTPAK